MDLQEGADLVMIKPGMPYLDVAISRTRMVRYTYQVGDKYATLKAAVRMLLETLRGSSGWADGALTYFARDGRDIREIET